MSSSDDFYGPSLPPGMQQASNDSDDNDDQYGPSLPPASTKPISNSPHSTTPSTYTQQKSAKVIGPVLPSNFPHSSKYSSDSDSDSKSSSSSSSDSDSNRRHRKKIKRLHHSHVSNRAEEVSPSMTVTLDKNTRVLGASLPQSDSNKQQDSEGSDDDEVIGPSLGLQASQDDLSAVNEFEARAMKMKQKLTATTTTDEAEAPKQRESWMTELPEQMGASFGLSNRQFRARNAPEQDSSWTEAPHEKGKKNKDEKNPKKNRNHHFKSDKDKQATKEIEAYNKKHRPESLLEMHKKELKKKKKKEEKKKKKKKDKGEERRPFDRDLDLKVNRFDNAQKQAYIKRSRELGSRFQSGGTGTSFL